jgi:hypothetical protein
MAHSLLVRDLPSGLRVMFALTLYTKRHLPGASLSRVSHSTPRSHRLAQSSVGTDPDRAAGSGHVQDWDGPIEGICLGEMAWCPPAEKHWHGAAPTTAMTHISIVEQLDGKGAGWMEHVSDEQYRK